MPVYSKTYNNTDYSPPAPEIEIVVSSSSKSEVEANIVALVDSGADATMLPVDILTDVHARYVETRQMRSVTGQTTLVSMYRVYIRVGPYGLSGLAVIAVQEGGEPILGRDVLNQLEVTLIGPAHELWIS